MDVNGTKFHLIYGQADWEACLSADYDLTLGQLRLEGKPLDVDYDHGFLQLFPRPPIFRQSGHGTATAGVVEGRGMTGDADGHIYSITDDGSAIQVQRAGQQYARPFWSPTTLERPAAGSGDFVPYTSMMPTARAARSLSTVRLRGLALTPQNYLVAGVEPEPGSTTGGLLLIPLSGGPFVQMTWRPDFSPAVITATADGNIWILDTANQQLWRVEVERQLDLSASDGNPSDFTPEADAYAVAAPRSEDYGVVGYDLADDLKNRRVVGLTAAPGNSALLLLRRGDSSDLLWYAFDTGQRSIQPVHSFEATLPNEDGKGTKPLPAIALAYVSYDANCTSWLRRDAGDSQSMDVVLLLEAGGNQTIAFELERFTDQGDESFRLALLDDYLPIRNWGGRGLAAVGCRVWYDSNGIWTPVQRFDDRAYEPRAVIVTSPDFPADYAVQPFDGEASGCVWHRLLLDAVIPPGCRVGIRARAADDPGVLIRMPWLDQPALYRRSVSSELPWYTPPPFLPPDPADAAASQSVDPACYDPAFHARWLDETGAGAWELLFQEVYGRYLQLELTLEGTGRTTPEIHALRAWYPRFSWLERYLPAIYREDRALASFLERWLANFEGFFTELEGLIEHFPAALDPRITPAEALEWLAGWMGLLLDPQWSEVQRRFFIRHAMSFYRLRGTPRGLEVALRLYLNDFDESIFRLRESSWRIRLREHFRVALLFQETPVNLNDRHAVNGVQCEAAHRFSVLIPPGLPADQRAMIERIVELEKPAHTTFKIEDYAGQLLLGSVILGEDTLLCKPAARILTEEALPRVLRGRAVNHPDLSPNVKTFDPAQCSPSAPGAVTSA